MEIIIENIDPIAEYNRKGLEKVLNEYWFDFIPLDRKIEILKREGLFIPEVHI